MIISVKVHVFFKCISYIFVDSTDKTIKNEFNQVYWSISVYNLYNSGLISVSPEFRKLRQEDLKAGQPG